METNNYLVVLTIQFKDLGELYEACLADTMRVKKGTETEDILRVMIARALKLRNLPEDTAATVLHFSIHPAEL